MKLVTYSRGSEYAVGVLKNDGAEVVPVNYLDFNVKDMNEFLEVQNEEKLAKMDRNKKNLTEAEDINRWQEHREELHKKRS